MSIPGLTDRSPSFKEIARLRKGKPKAQGLGDLDHFRMDWRPDLNHLELEAVEIFKAAYGDQPNHIKARLAFTKIDRVWDANFRCYNSAGLLGQAGGIDGLDGLYWHYLRDNKTGKMLVHDSRSTETGEPVPFDPKIPVYSYKNKKGQDVAVYARPEGQLKLLLPELRLANYVTLMTHSWYDIGNISEELAAIQETAQNVGMTLPMVPLVISRRMDTISVSYDGRKRMEQRSLIHVDIDPSWSGPQFDLLQAVVPGTALPSGRQIEVPALPANLTDDEEPDPGWSEGQADETSTKNGLAVAEAAMMKTPKGTLLEELTEDQLRILIERGSTDLKKAAWLLLEPPAAKARKAWAQAAVRADDLGITFDTLPEDANNLALYKSYGRLMDLIAKAEQEPIQP